MDDLVGRTGLFPFGPTYLQIKQNPVTSLWEVSEGELILGKFTDPGSAAYAADQYVASNFVKGDSIGNDGKPTERSILRDIFGEG